MGWMAKVRRMAGDCHVVSSRGDHPAQHVLASNGKLVDGSPHLDALEQLRWMQAYRNPSISYASYCLATSIAEGEVLYPSTRVLPPIPVRNASFDQCGRLDIRTHAICENTSTSHYQHF